MLKILKISVYRGQSDINNLFPDIQQGVLIEHIKGRGLKIN